MSIECGETDASETLYMINEKININIVKKRYSIIEFFLCTYDVFYLFLKRVGVWSFRDENLVASLYLNY